jgi:hypothetical protein
MARATTFEMPRNRSWLQASFVMPPRAPTCSALTAQAWSRARRG